MKNKICSLILAGVLMFSVVDISMRFVPEPKKQVIAGHTTGVIRFWAEVLSSIDWSKWRDWGHHPRDKGN